ncbi:MAG: 50S ribosomal protein L24 [bacterium]|nr:50S ribosomal protein L24 [bacterium]
MKIRKNDQVIVISGKDKGKKGKVLQVAPKQDKIIVEAINLRKKHAKPKKSGEKGEIIQLPRFFHVSNVKLICPKCSQPTRVGYKIMADKIPGNKAAGNKKFRICKKCEQEI